MVDGGSTGYGNGFGDAGRVLVRNINGDVEAKHCVVCCRIYGEVWEVG